MAAVGNATRRLVHKRKLPLADETVVTGALLGSAALIKRIANVTRDVCPNANAKPFLDGEFAPKRNS